MPFVTVRDLRIYYEIRGTGPRLLSISGTGGDLRRSPNICSDDHNSPNTRQKPAICPVSEHPHDTRRNLLAYKI